MLKICKEGTLLGLNSVEGGHVVQYVKGGGQNEALEAPKGSRKRSFLKEKQLWYMWAFPKDFA